MNVTRTARAHQQIRTASLLLDILTRKREPPVEETRLCHDCKYYVPANEHLDGCKYGKCVRSVSSDGHPVYHNSKMYVTVDGIRFAALRVMSTFGCVEWAQSNQAPRSKKNSLTTGHCDGCARAVVWKSSSNRTTH